MKIRYCLPIIKTTKAEVLKTIEENKTKYDYFEVWLDYVTDYTDVFLKYLVDLLGSKLIVLFRRKDLEKIRLNYKDRLVILALLNKTPSLVDLDINANKKELTYLQVAKSKTKTIVSYHNYKNTPTMRSLKATVKKMKQYHPTIVKIATLCKEEVDSVRLLELQQALITDKQKHIVLGMGKFGTITRVFGTLFGNEMIFAPKTLDEISADGQLTKEQLEKIFLVLQK